MAANAAVVGADADAVFEVLCRPDTYPRFIVGTRSVHRFDSSWPEIGSVVHHSQGVGPFVVRGRTFVTEVESGRLLVLRAELGRLGVHRLHFALAPVAGGTKVEVEEHPIEGLSATLWNPVSEAMMSGRNRMLLRRLGAVAACLVDEHSSAAEARSTFGS